ncbi:UvrD-helicase domain-containing protein [Hathewaya massiliensis]|uniref:UvrD-helicase domain-containing protein n=1 Tax=Hathewaya massiliensis TaxID=1964382 RepID=UPI00115A5F61|nr:UvrD-helicase domain-containing protein [Hathewaya massiliensis]
MSNNAYSVLIYQREVSKYTFYLIKDYISEGTKVYFLTESDEVDLYSYIQDVEKKDIKYYEQKYLLSMNYNINLSFQFKDDFIIEDGNISENLREELKEECFNIEQYDIEHLNRDKHIIIKAGAGTGKTKTMIDRTIYLRHKELATFKDMVMITFTNKAANQMKQKLYERLEAYYEATKDTKYLEWIDEIVSMRIQTIHSFAKNFIELLGDRINIDRKSKIKSIQYEKYKILEKLINEYRFKFSEKYQKFRYIPQYKLIKAILKIEQYLTSKGLNVSDNKENINFGVDKEEFNHFLEFLLLNLCEEVKQYKYENSIIELNDLVISLKRYLHTVNIQNAVNIKYIMVDEFQDSDTIQVDFIIWLIENMGCKTFIVGDIKQSIYRFRGAEYTAFLQFEDKLKRNGEEKNITKKSLKKNYRTNKAIIDKLNNFFYNISNLETSREETKYFTFTKGDKLEPVIENNSKEEVISLFKNGYETNKDGVIEYITNEIKKNNKRNASRAKEGLESESIAILVRSNRDLEYIVRELEKKDYICKKEVSGEFYRSIAVREFYLMLKALLYPKVYINQYAFINSSYGKGIDNNTILENYDSSNNYLKKIIENRKEYKTLQYFNEKIKQEPFMKVLHQLVNEFKPEINYGVKILSNRGFKEENETIKSVKTAVINYKMNLEHLFTILDKRFNSIDASIIDVIRFLELMIKTDDLEDEKMLDYNNKENKYDAICMTVHKAKGLEFDHVIIPKTSNSFLNNNNEVKIFLNEKVEKHNIGYLVNLDDLTLKNDVYSEFIVEENKEIIAEEIRLLYVALTRAKKTIHLNKNEIMDNSGKIHNWMDLLERGNLKDA